MTTTQNTSSATQRAITHGLGRVPLAISPLNRKDFTSDQEVRWCPGCGDYAVLAAFQAFLPELGIKRENTVIISGIGCSSRFPYYVDSYGMHSIHGRAPAIATGVAATREDLAVFVVTGDGDALSIGGNHLMHALRRNINITILLFNNRIYGLTKGQYSPTSEMGKVTKSTPLGSLDQPLNPLSLALGSEATFVARALDSDRKGLSATLKAATAHRGASLVEIYQNCPIFNDGAFEALKGGDESAEAIIPLNHGEPIVFGIGGHLAVVRDRATTELRIAERAAVDEADIVVHDAHADNPAYAFALSRLGGSGHVLHSPVGIFRQVDRPTYDDEAREQVRTARGDTETSDASLQDLLNGEDTWDVEA